MRHLLLVLALVLPAHAQVVTSTLLLPSYGGSTQIRWASTPDQMRCFRVAARLGITNATKMAGGVMNGGGGSTVCGWAIYADADAGARLATISGICPSVGIVSAVGLPPFSLVQGTVYRLCTCASASGGLYTGIYDTQGAAGSSDGSVGGQSDVLNAVVNRAAVAANPCTTGAPPLTTGALTPTTHRTCPLIIVDKD